MNPEEEIEQLKSTVTAQSLQIAAFDDAAKTARNLSAIIALISTIVGFAIALVTAAIVFNDERRAWNSIKEQHGISDVNPIAANHDALIEQLESRFLAQDGVEEALLSYGFLTDSSLDGVLRSGDVVRMRTTYRPGFYLAHGNRDENVTSRPVTNADATLTWSIERAD